MAAANFLIGGRESFENARTFFWRMWPWMLVRTWQHCYLGTEREERTREMTDLTGDLSSTCQPLQGTPLPLATPWLGVGPLLSTPDM
jgi:hypothetical protein